MKFLVDAQLTNAALLGLFETNLGAVVAAIGDADFVEPGPAAMLVHRRRDSPES